MELVSKFDFKSLRKAQSKIVKKFNRAAKSLGNLGLSNEQTKAIEGMLQPMFEAELEKLMKEGAPVEEKEEVESFV